MTYAVPDNIDIISGSGTSSGIGEGWYVQHFQFVNYCPNCHYYNCLEVGYKRYDEITCLRCDSDFSFTGKEKHDPPRAWLTLYVEPEPEPVVSKMEIAQPVPLTPLEKANQTFQNHELIVLDT